MIFNPQILDQMASRAALHQELLAALKNFHHHVQSNLSLGTLYSANHYMQQYTDLTAAILGSLDGHEKLFFLYEKLFTSTQYEDYERSILLKQQIEDYDIYQ